MLCDISLIREKKETQEILSKEGVKNIKADKYSMRRNVHTQACSLKFVLSQNSNINHILSKGSLKVGQQVKKKQAEQKN